MKTSIERLDGNSVRLTVTVPAEDVDAAIDEAYARVAQKVKVPGFRAGKAPKPVIDTHVGRDAVIADAQDELLSESYSKALDAEDLRPIAQPEIDDLGLMEPGADFEYVAEIEVRPDGTLTSTEDLKITVPSPNATDREIDAQIENMRERFASLEPVEGRGVAEGDFVLVSFAGKVDGEEYEGNTVDKYLYEMNRGLMPVEFDLGIIDVEPGGEAKVSFEVPETSSSADFVGKIATFDVTVHEIKEKVLPELDDEFAMTAGGFDTFEEMRDAVRSQLDQSKSVGHMHARESESRKALAERLECDIPDSMIQNTKNQMLRDFVTGLEGREMTLDQYLETTGTSIEQMEFDMGVRAMQSVREELALEALFRELEFEITEEDIDEELAMFSSSADKTPEELRAEWEATGVIKVLYEQITHKKAVMWLLDNVEIAEDDGEGADTPDGAVEAAPEVASEAAPDDADEAAGDETPDEAADEAAGDEAKE